MLQNAMKWIVLIDRVASKLIYGFASSPEEKEDIKLDAEEPGVVISKDHPANQYLPPLLRPP